MLVQLPEVREIMITQGANITDAALESLGQKRDLRILHLLECPQLTPAAVAKLRQALPDCDVRLQ